jgi:fatty acid desaturase
VLRPIARNRTDGKQDAVMIWTIAAILLALWLAGMISAYTLAGFLHVLLVVATVLVLFNVVVGRRPL